MSLKINKKIKIIVGNFNLKDGPNDIFNNNIISFLNEISKEVLNNSKCKKFPDLISFDGVICNTVPRPILFLKKL